VTRLDHGPLQDLGLAEHYIVIAVDGKDVPDAASFAKLVDSEYTVLADRGGTLRLLVQTETGDPREFSTQLAGKVVPVPASATHPGGKHHDVDHSTGVNIWDATGGNRKATRDDPTQ
jgi:hypothetical protein